MPPVILMKQIFKKKKKKTFLRYSKRKVFSQIDMINIQWWQSTRCSTDPGWCCWRFWHFSGWL